MADLQVSMVKIKEIIMEIKTDLILEIIRATTMVRMTALIMETKMVTIKGKLMVMITVKI
jgi:hypothetical protein